MIRPIIVGHNCENFIKDCFESLHAQNVPFEGVIVNDGSNDRTGDLLAQYDTVYHSRKQRGPAASRWFALQMIEQHHDPHPDDIIALIDMDDRLNDPNAFQIIQAKYDNGADLTYGSCVTKSGKYLSEPYPDEVIQNKSYRKYPWKCYHLRTFRWGLFKKVGFTEQWFQFDNGEWYQVCTDVALMHPLLEESNKPTFVREPLYFYNDVGNHVGRAKHPLSLWAETNRHINENHKRRRDEN